MGKGRCHFWPNHCLRPVAHESSLLPAAMTGAERQLAARLGYAWRMARKAGGTYSDPTLEVVADLHAEALVRLGHRLLPRVGGGPAAALQHAPEQVHRMVDLLVSVADSNYEAAEAEYDVDTSRSLCLRANNAAKHKSIVL